MCPDERQGGRRVFDSDLDRLQDTFNVLDRDGDGIIASSDLEHFLHKVVASKLISKDDVKNMLALVEGDVDFDQFKHLLHVEPETNISAFSFKRNNATEASEDMFRVLDRNGDGFVCSDDITSMIENLRRRLPAKDIQAMLQGVGGGPGSISRKVTYEEFSQYIN